MMAKSNTAKWIVGFTGAALSAFVISQVNDTGTQNQGTPSQKQSATGSMSKQEQKLVQLDWSNYSINGAAVSDPNSDTNRIAASDRQTSRS